MNNILVTLNNADYLIIDGRAGGTGPGYNLRIHNTSTASSTSTLEMINGSCNNVLRYVDLVNPAASAAGPRVFAFGTSTVAGGNSDNIVEYCKVHGSRTGIATGGSAAPNKNVNNLVKGCEIYDCPFTGVWSSANTGTVIVDSCTFYSTTLGNTGASAIIIDATDNISITRNRMYDISATGTNTVKAINARNASAGLIANNFISLTNNTTSTSVTGIEFSSSGLQTFQLFNNTVKIGGTLASGGTSGNVVSTATAKLNTNTSASYTFVNNILVNERSGGTSGVQHLVSNISSTNGAVIADYNTYNSTSGQYVRLTTTVVPFTTYQGLVAPNEANSNLESVSLVSNTDLHLQPSMIGNTNILGATQASVTKDIDNQTRNTPPYRGADEPISPLPVELLNIAAAVTGNDVLLNWTTASEKDIDHYELERSADGNTFSFLSKVKMQDAKQFTKEYTYLDRDAFTEQYPRQFYRLKIVDKNKSHSYSRIVTATRHENKKGELTVHPNPFSGQVTISLDSKADGKAQLSLTDNLGKVVYNSVMTLHRGNNNLNVQLPEMLNKGVYLIKVETADGIYVSRVVKQ